MALILVTSINLVLDYLDYPKELESFSLEKNDSEKESDDLDLEKKEAIPQTYLQLNKNLSSILYHRFSYGYRTLEHFEKIPTPPPEV